jgi:antitoxin VapB
MRSRRGPAVRRLAAARVDTTFAEATQEAIVALNIRNDEVSRLAEALAARTRLSKTEAVKRALQNELQRLDKSVPLKERIRPIQERIAAWPSTGLEADKAFFDELSGDT